MSFKETIELAHKDEKNNMEKQGIPNLDGRSKTTGWRKKMGLYFVIIGFIITFLLVWNSFIKNKALEKEKKNTANIQKNVPKKEFSENEIFPFKSDTSHLVYDLPVIQKLVEKQDVPLVEIDQSSSHLMVEDDAVSSNKKANLSQILQDSLSVESADTGSLASLLKSTKTQERKAFLLSNRHYLLTKGTFIDCVLQTRLDSTVPGMTSCIVTRNIYGDTGKVLLIEKGSTLLGEYQSNLKRGQARIFVLWNRLKTPNGVVAHLDSSASDELGGAGIPGFIDDHFWQRLGGAILLSFIQDAGRAFADRLNQKDQASQIHFYHRGDPSQGIATEALKSTLNIPPTLYKNQGEKVGVLVARDLNFKDVYDLQLKK